MLPQQPDKATEGKECRRGQELTAQLPDRQPELQVKQEEVLPNDPALRTFERTTKSISPQRFTVGEAIACHVLYEFETYEQVLDLPQPERGKWLQAGRRLQGRPPGREG